jgi:hypothetical protein
MVDKCRVFLSNSKTGGCMALETIHRKSIRVITREQLHEKLANARLGQVLPPDAPSILRNKPADDCDICTGTGWAWSEKYETFLVCRCTGDRPDFTPKDYTDV